MSHHHHDTALAEERIRIRPDSMLAKLPLLCAFVGLAGFGGAFALKGTDAQQFYYSYLTMFMGFLAFSLGGLFFVILQHAVRAGWSVVVRRLAENVAMTLPLMALLAVPPLFLGAHDLFHWTHEELVAKDPMLSAKNGYLDLQFFYVRAAIYFGIWIGFAFFFRGLSLAQDRSSNPEAESHRMRWFAPLGILLVAASLTFAAFDWLMSLDPHWFSTIFGVYFFAGSMLSIHAFLVLAVLGLQRAGYLVGVVTIEHLHDLGKYLFGFTVFWAYIGFSQYMLIWYASIPEETFWYAYRGHGAWLGLSLVLVFSRFVFPFLGLIPRTIKRIPRTIAFWAAWVVTAEFIDVYWLVQPALAHERNNHHLPIGLLDLALFVGIGGLWFAVFTWCVVRAPLVPLKDPRLQESLHFENA